MDLQPSQLPGATASSSTSIPDLESPETKTLRSSARVKAAKQKSLDKEQTSTGEVISSERQSSSSGQHLPDSSISRGTRTKRPREGTSGKGKAKETTEGTSRRRTRRNANTTSNLPLTIQEPVKDPKGKKRAAPEPSSEEDNSAFTSTKRSRTTSYALRSQTSNNQPSTDMPKKTRSVAKGKMAVNANAKAKAIAAAAGSSQQMDADIEMADSEFQLEEDSDQGDHEMAVDEDSAEGCEGEHEPQTEEMDGRDGGEGEDDDEDNDDDDENSSGLIRGTAPGGLDEAAALAIFGDYRQFGSYMMSLSSRLKTMLNNIKMTVDPTTRLLTLQELSELLSISTEDTLAGSFQVEQYVKELIKILGGRGVDEDEDDEGDSNEKDEDLAAALAMSASGTFQGDENPEAQVLACRCLANLMEALPGVAHTVVYHGAIPVLCSKLIEISYIDLAEQTLSTMEKISEEFPSSIVREGGLSALLNYLDFFSIAVQRTALQAASNCCRNVSSEHFSQILGVWPIIRNCLSYSDQRLVEFACLCVIRVIDSYHRTSVGNLESLVDTDLIRAILQLLLPAGGSPMIAPNTFTLLIRALATCARASPKITVALLEADVVETVYQILTGVLPSAAESHSEQGDSSTGQGLGGSLADMTVMENLAHRPKDQVEETLGLISELMPPLPKDGVFDYKSYTEKALSRMVKAKAKADRAAARAAAHAPFIAAGLIAAPLSTPEETPADSENPTPQEGDATNSLTPASGRTDILRSKIVVVARFMQLTVPILIDVYAASVNTPVRVKALTGLLKAISFLDADGVKQVLKFVPVASFASSILSSKDQPQLVIGALQLVDLLLAKDPSLYQAAFRREGVFHEIEMFAVRTLISSKSKEKADKEKDKDTSETTSTDSTPAPPSSAATIPGYKKLSSLSLDPDDAITLRARIIKFKYLAGEEQGEGENTLSGLRTLVDRLEASSATEKEYSEALWDIANLFASPHTSVSSFELIQSGLVDGLLRFAMDKERQVPANRRKELLLEALVNRRNKSTHGTHTPFTTFVKKLQESLTRMESFEVVTVSQSSDDSKRSSPSLLARQLRLRLVADDESGVPRTLHNIVVSIHAIATFQALHDYLRPRVAGGIGSSSSRLSGMLAALAASGFPGPSSRLSGESSQPDIPTPPASSSVSGPAETPSATIARRRSQRLSAKKASNPNNDDSADSTTFPPTEPIASTSTAPPEPSTEGPAASEVAPSETLVADFTDDEDEVDAEVFDDDMDPDNSISDKTVTLSVAEDGSKVEAQTPDGTRVATPAQKEGAPSSYAGPSGSLTRPSYAAALKTKPTDWHLEFVMDDHVLPLDLTIYGAIHQHEMRKTTGSLPPSMLWQGIYTIKFKKVPGPLTSPDTDNAESSVKARSSTPNLSCLAEDTPHAKILRLLRVLHSLNTLEAERSAFGGDRRHLPETAFINNKLTAKLTRQLEEPMIVASSCLPDWALDLPQHFPFLFPFATRYNFLQSTSFGYARLILKWQSQQARGQDSSRRDDSIGFLGRLHRQKVRISRKHVLESAVKVFEMYGSSSSVLEVEYFEEVGTGLGPTLEFYSLVSKEFARKDLKIWRDVDHTNTNVGTYVNHPVGLYPAPLSTEDIASDGGQKKLHVFRVIGQFVAKAMLDSRIIDLSFNKIFLKLVLGEEVSLTIASLKLVDLDLANSLTKLLNIANGSNQNNNDKIAKKLALLEVTVEDLALDFTLPGYDVELRSGGKDIAVTSQNAPEYVQEVLNAILGQGAAQQAKAFREGFSKVFPINDLQPFSADELVMLFGNADEDWSIETLNEALKADHGFNPESRAIRDLVEVMADYDPQTRRDYLQFITGSPKLPIGGFRGLNPPFTVVRKPHEAPLTADDYLPSVMTCVNYLKLPEYSSKAVMKEKLRIAMKEGVGSFHLS